MLTKKLEGTAEKMNALGKAREPFFFAVDFDAKAPIVIPMSEIEDYGILIDFNGTRIKKTAVEVTSKPLDFNSYANKLEMVKSEIIYGNSYLCNLTAQTEIATKLSLQDLYQHAIAQYKILFKDKWLCFSPETFVEMKKDTIYSYPMKGTIDATIPNAKEILLTDKKEIAEHYTIVDLIRNDLSMVSTNVRVERFRFITEIKTAKGELLQASSKISGDLDPDWRDHLGNILCKLLPAGSISGAPKKKTVEIIKRIEGYERGFYTGVAGVFDGESLDSCVLIRFIEKTDNGYVYKSGGGITKYSDAKKEYEELIQKIYVPTT